jgi:hypothetical protein
LDLPLQNVTPTEKRPRRYWGYIWSAFFVLLLVIYIGGMTPGIPPRRAWHSIESEHVRLIAQAMLRYAQDHQGRYPSGKSSTEVFQKILDGGYADYYEIQASLFYFPIKGKTPPLAGQPLKPENVCFDVTGLAASSDSDELPLVFSTGFKVSYEPGASAIRLAPLEFRWPGFELFRPDPGPIRNCIIIGYKQPQAHILFVTADAANPNGLASGFIPADFRTNGKNYQQLTPDGVLPNN